MLYDLFFIFIILVWCINEKKIFVEECNVSKLGNGFLIDLDLILFLENFKILCIFYIIVEYFFDCIKNN